MARHAQPRELAELKGMTAKNPQRYRGKVPKNPEKIGSPPEYMADDARACWAELVSLSLPDVLTATDRPVMEIASNLLAEYRRGPDDFSIGKYTHLRGALASLGMTPADRQKLAVDEKDDDGGFVPLN